MCLTHAHAVACQPRESGASPQHNSHFAIHHLPTHCTSVFMTRTTTLTNPASPDTSQTSFVSPSCAPVRVPLFVCQADCCPPTRCFESHSSAEDNHIHRRQRFEIFGFFTSRVSCVPVVDGSEWRQDDFARGMRMQALSMHAGRISRPCACKHSSYTLTANHGHASTQHARDRHSRPCVQALSMYTSNESFLQTSGHAPIWPALHEPPCAWSSMICRSLSTAIHSCANHGHVGSMHVPCLSQHSQTMADLGLCQATVLPQCTCRHHALLETTVLTHRTCHHHDHHHHAHCRKQSRAVQKSSW
jgi:hypothetical protein